MTGTINGNIELAGVSDIPVTAVFSASYVDNGIGAYEFWGARGTHHDWQWEIEEVYGLEFDCNVHEQCADYLSWIGFSKANRKHYLKTLRRKVNQVRKALAASDPNEVFDNDALCDEASRQAPEPDYNED